MPPLLLWSKKVGILPLGICVGQIKNVSQAYTVGQTWDVCLEILFFNMSLHKEEIL